MKTIYIPLMFNMFVYAFTHTPDVKLDNLDNCKTASESRPQIEVKAELVRCVHDSDWGPGGRQARSSKTSYRGPHVYNFIGFDWDEEVSRSDVNRCRRKLILTMKVHNFQKTEIRDEYITLDHVHDPITRRRTKLLNPYVIRIIQGLPTQLYGLNFVQMVNGEATEEVISKADASFPGCTNPQAGINNVSHRKKTGCSTDAPNANLGPPCGSEKFTGTFQQGFCCSCVNSDSEKSLNRKKGEKDGEEDKAFPNKTPDHFIQNRREHSGEKSRRPEYLRERTNQLPVVHGEKKLNRNRPAMYNIRPEYSKGIHSEPHEKEIKKNEHMHQHEKIPAYKQSQHEDRPSKVREHVKATYEDSSGQQRASLKKHHRPGQLETSHIQHHAKVKSKEQLKTHESSNESLKKSQRLRNEYKVERKNQKQRSKKLNVVTELSKKLQPVSDEFELKSVDGMQRLKTHELPNVSQNLEDDFDSELESIGDRLNVVSNQPKHLRDSSMQEARNNRESLDSPEVLNHVYLIDSKNKRQPIEEFNIQNDFKTRYDGLHNRVKKDTDIMLQSLLNDNLPLANSRDKSLSDDINIGRMSDSDGYYRHFIGNKYPDDIINFGMYEDQFGDKNTVPHLDAKIKTEANVIRANHFRDKWETLNEVGDHLEDADKEISSLKDDNMKLQKGIDTVLSRKHENDKIGVVTDDIISMRNEVNIHSNDKERYNEPRNYDKFRPIHSSDEKFGLDKISLYENDNKLQAMVELPLDLNETSIVDEAKSIPFNIQSELDLKGYQNRDIPIKNIDDNGLLYNPNLLKQLIKEDYPEEPVHKSDDKFRPIQMYIKEGVNDDNPLVMRSDQMYIKQNVSDDAVEPRRNLIEPNKEELNGQYDELIKSKIEDSLQNSYMNDVRKGKLKMHNGLLINEKHAYDKAKDRVVSIPLNENEKQYKGPAIEGLKLQSKQLAQIDNVFPKKIVDKENSEHINDNLNHEIATDDSEGNIFDKYIGENIDLIKKHGAEKRSTIKSTEFNYSKSLKDIDNSEFHNKIRNGQIDHFKESADGLKLRENHGQGMNLDIILSNGEQELDRESAKTNNDDNMEQAIHATENKSVDKSEGEHIKKNDYLTDIFDEEAPKLEHSNTSNQNMKEHDDDKYSTKNVDNIRDQRNQVQNNTYGQARIYKTEAKQNEDDLRDENNEIVFKKKPLIFKEERKSKNRPVYLAEKAEDNNEKDEDNGKSDKQKDRHEKINESNDKNEGIKNNQAEEDSREDVENGIEKESNDEEEEISDQNNDNDNQKEDDLNDNNGQIDDNREQEVNNNGQTEDSNDNEEERVDENMKNNEEEEKTDEKEDINDNEEVNDNEKESEESDNEIQSQQYEDMEENPVKDQKLGIRVNKYHEINYTISQNDELEKKFALKHPTVEDDDLKIIYPKTHDKIFLNNLESLSDNLKQIRLKKHQYEDNLGKNYSVNNEYYDQGMKNSPISTRRIFQKSDLRHSGTNNNKEYLLKNKRDRQQSKKLHNQNREVMDGDMIKTHSKQNVHKHNDGANRNQGSYKEDTPRIKNIYKTKHGNNLLDSNQGRNYQRDEENTLFQDPRVNREQNTGNNSNEHLMKARIYRDNSDMSIDSRLNEESMKKFDDYEEVNPLEYQIIGRANSLPLDANESQYDQLYNNFRERIQNDSELLKFVNELGLKLGLDSKNLDNVGDYNDDVDNTQVMDKVDHKKGSTKTLTVSNTNNHNTSKLVNVTGNQPLIDNSSRSGTSKTQINMKIHPAAHSHIASTLHKSAELNDSVSHSTNSINQNVYEKNEYMADSRDKYSKENNNIGEADKYNRPIDLGLGQNATLDSIGHDYRHNERGHNYRHGEPGELFTYDNPGQYTEHYDPGQYMKHDNPSEHIKQDYQGKYMKHGNLSAQYFKHDDLDHDIAHDDTGQDIKHDYSDKYIKHNDLSQYFKNNDRGQYIKDYRPGKYIKHDDPGQYIKPYIYGQYFKDDDQGQYMKNNDPDQYIKNYDPDKFTSHHDPSQYFKQNDPDQYIRHDDPGQYIKQDDPGQYFNQDNSSQYLKQDDSDRQYYRKNNLDKVNTLDDSINNTGNNFYKYLFKDDRGSVESSNSADQIIQNRNPSWLNEKKRNFEIEQHLSQYRLENPFKYQYDVLKIAREENMPLPSLEVTNKLNDKLRDNRESNEKTNYNQDAVSKSLSSKNKAHGRKKKHKVDAGQPVPPNSIRSINSILNKPYPELLQQELKIRADHMTTTLNNELQKNTERIYNKIERKRDSAKSESDNVDLNYDDERDETSLYSFPAVLSHKYSHEYFPDIVNDKPRALYPNIAMNKNSIVFPSVYHRKIRDSEDINKVGERNKRNSIPNDIPFKTLITDHDLTTNDKMKLLKLIDTTGYRYDTDFDNLKKRYEQHTHDNLDNFGQYKHSSNVAGQMLMRKENYKYGPPSADRLSGDHHDDWRTLYYRRERDDGSCDVDSDESGPSVMTHSVEDMAHCMKFSDIWYKVFSLSQPTLSHSIAVQVFEKRSSPGRPERWYSVTGPPIRMTTEEPHVSDGQSITFIYTLMSDQSLYGSGDFREKEVLYKLEPEVNRLLIPQPSPAQMARKYPQLQGGPGEYLVLKTYQTGPDCGKAGVSFRAFAHARGSKTESKSCLSNQPLQFWRHDKKSEKCGKNGKYFLKYFGNLQTDAIRKYRDGQQAIALGFSGPVDYTIEGELRADSNVLIRIGTAARITEIHVDSTCPLNTILLVEVTNLGLASAGFLVRISDCAPGLPYQWGNLEGRIIVIAPQKSHRYTIRVPGPPSTFNDVFYCSVEILNKRRELIAIRRAKIKPFNRCLCVLHCLCACLINSVEGLKCKSMSSNHLHAAGFQGSPPYSSSGGPTDIESLLLDILVFTCVMLLILLILGLTKGCIGLCCNTIVGVWGLDAYGGGPRELMYYNEPEFRDRSVVYDEWNYPVNPETGRRTVRVHSKTTELLMNIVFFLVFPYVLLCRLLRKICCGSPVDMTDSDACLGWGHHVTMQEPSWMSTKKEDDELTRLLETDDFCGADCPKDQRGCEESDACNRLRAAGSTLPNEEVAGLLRRSKSIILTTYSGACQEVRAEKFIIAQFTRSEETLLENGYEVRTQNLKEMAELDGVDHNELVLAQELVTQLRKARVVFRHLRCPIGGAAVPLGMMYCVRGYFMRGAMEGTTFITPTPLLQYWKFLESGEIEAIAPPIVLKSSEFTANYSGALMVLRTGDLSLTRNAPCINDRRQGL